jgi:hypothetical protein
MKEDEDNAGDEKCRTEEDWQDATGLVLPRSQGGRSPGPRMRELKGNCRANRQVAAKTKKPRLKDYSSKD